MLKEILAHQISDQTRASKPKVLWVDDEEYILTSVKRLLRNQEIELITETDSVSALELLKKNSFALIISDQRMPKMSGIELLSQAKTICPESVRIMVTGFMDQSLIKEAVNRAGVFRFITKPWIDEVVINDIKNAIQLSKDKMERSELLKRTSIQNKKLISLTSDLESEVEERTKSLFESRNSLRTKESNLRDLIRFIQELSESNSLEELFVVVKQELRQLVDATEIALLIAPAKEKSILYYIQAGANVIKKSIDDYVYTEQVRQNDIRDQSLLANVLGRPVSRVFAIPLQRRSSDDVQTQTTLFIELAGQQKIDALEFSRLSETIQPLSIAIDRILISEDLRDTAAHWAETFDSIDDPISILGSDFSSLRSNVKFRTNTAGTKCYELFANRKEPCNGCALLQAYNSNTSQIAQINTGEKFFEVRSYPLKFGNENEQTLVINHYTDITESQMLYGQLIQSEKMAALGSLAGNIAHELNNPLTGIRALTQYLIAKVDSEQLRDDLSEIQNAAERSQLIIKNLLEFASETGTKDEIVSLNDIVKKTLPLLKTVLRHLNSEVIYHEHNPKIVANSHLLQQVLFNLVTNASHAMPNGGDIKIEVYSTQEQAGISIKDSGPGISQELQSKIFEPFFTTKKAGQGTGLGLSMCKSIVKEFGGEIKLVTEVGRGSDFQITFSKVE